MEDYYKERKRLSELILGSYTFNNLSVNIHWLQMILNGKPYKRFHSHSGCEMFFMIEGKHEFHFRDQNVILEAGQGVIIPPRCKHLLVNPGEGRCLQYNICFEFDPQSEISDSMKSVFLGEKALIFQFHQEIKDILDACLMEAVHRESDFTSRIQLKFHDLLIWLTRNLASDMEPDFPAQTRRLMNDTRYHLIEQYILQNINQQLTSMDISNFLNLSSKQINRIISSSSEYKNATDMIANLKLDVAKKLLIDPHLRASDISDMLGFSSEYYFNRFFKKMEGLPPGRFRDTIGAKS